MTLSILIVNWNSKAYVRRCLETVRATCAELAPEVIVVDAGSFDGCGEMLATEFPEVIFIQSPDNLGFGRSNNLGFQRVRGQYLLLLNPDTELLEGAVRLLLNCLQHEPAAGLAAPRLLNSDGSLQAMCVRASPTALNRALESELLRRWFPRSRLLGTVRAFNAIEPVEVEAVSGACMLLRSDTFRRVGGFSECFFMYGEDIDLCAKIRSLGLKVYHVPKARVVHHGGGASASQPNELTTILQRSAGETYMRLHHGKFGAFNYRVLQALSALARIVYAVALRCLAHRQNRQPAHAAFLKGFTILRWAFGFAKFRGSAARQQPSQADRY